MMNLLSYSLPQEGMFTSNRSVLKMFFLIIFSAFLLFIHCNHPTKDPAPPTKPNEVKFVFAAAGLRLREAPDLKSKNIITIPYGSEVEILRKTGIGLSVDAYTSGEWVEAKWKDKTGYAFDGYLLDKKEFARYEKAYKYVQQRLVGRKEIKEYNISLKYLKYDRIDKASPVPMLFLQIKSNSNFTVVTFMLEKYPNQEHCNLYISSTCINVILDNKDNIIFTDLDSESIGMIDFMDEEIVRFSFFGGDGDYCSFGGITISFVYIFESKTYVKQELSTGRTCIDPDKCNGSDHNFVCKKWKEYVIVKYSIAKPSAKIKEYFKRAKESEKK